jgi:hypothetical protein
MTLCVTFAFFSFCLLTLECEINPDGSHRGCVFCLQINYHQKQRGFSLLESPLVCNGWLHVADGALKIYGWWAVEVGFTYPAHETLFKPHKYGVE